MISDFNFYKIFNKAEFEALDLVSKEYNLTFADLGPKTILVTKGNTISITYEGVLLSLELNDKNPFEFDGYAIFLSITGDVYLGINKDQYED